MKNFSLSNLKLVLVSLGCGLLAACGTPKDTAMSRGMQNLTARYNYIYNSNVILENYEADIYDTYVDNYSEILPVYTNPEKFSSSTVLYPPPNERALDAIIKKAQAIIADKSFSNYIDDSYLLLGKAHFFKTNYFVSEEYFDYTAKTYGSNLNVEMTALNWKARSLMQTDNLNDAALVLDTVYDKLPQLKKNKSEPIATIAQMYIYQQRFNDAITLLEIAAKETKLKRNRIRWTYILAQLYEKQKDYKRALADYIKVEKSNANFELYFNANLNKIRLDGLLNGEKLSRKKQLLALLRDDKNLEYHDQIYFQVAESFADDGDFTEAEKYYKLSVRKSMTNKYQKGLSYLKLANLNFNQFKNFLKAKSYYDSTVNTLPKTYPGYDLIHKKSENLEYLSSRYEVIAFEDTLQMLAKLPEKDRLARVKKIMKPAPLPVLNNGAADIRENPFPDAVKKSPAAIAASSFYFNNLNAVSRGYTDFLTKWGNRKREDNWRQSLKSSSQTTSEDIAKVEDEGIPLNGKPHSAATAKNDTTANKYLSAVPVTPELLNASNQKIIDTYYEIANFYQQELDDQQEATRIYELLLTRFPENNRLASIYYSLYLSYTKTSPEKAGKYKELVLKQFPNSSYAKTILDPRYSAKQSEMEAIALQKYNQIFDKYAGKAFPQVIADVNATVAQYPDNLMNPQLSYLRAIAIGRTNPIDSLVPAFKAITTLYPDDKLVVPLVKAHLDYIASHRSEFVNRKVALPDFDPTEPRFFAAESKTPEPANNPYVNQPVKEFINAAPIAKPVQTANVPAAAVKKPVEVPVKVTDTAAKTITKQLDVAINYPPDVQLPPVPVKLTDTAAKPAQVITKLADTAIKTAAVPEKLSQTPVKAPEVPVKEEKIFSKAISKVYYYVIDVADASLTLSSSRFGIGQFNRGNYAQSGLRHQLTEFDNDQLIYVGNFSSFAEAKSYADGITPQLKQIMKVPAGIYSSFIISQENFEKLKSKDLVTKYLEFYKNNY